MVNFEYLLHGIHALANAHPAGTMAGHLGAAVVAGYLFGENQADLPEQVYRGIEGELDRIMRGEEAIWFNARKVGLKPADLFRPVEGPAAGAGAERVIAETLLKHAGTLKQSGHDVIFASIALRALHDHPEFATEAHIDGIRRLISRFATTGPGRGYFGREDGWRMGSAIGTDELPVAAPYGDVTEMAVVTMTEVTRSASQHRQGFGGLWHLINHAAGIAELHRLGYRKLARKALPAHHHHLRLWRFLPDLHEELGPMVKASEDPRRAKYWTGMLKRDQARLTHRIKTMYGFSVLSAFIEDPELKKRSEDAFLYLLA